MPHNRHECLIGRLKLDIQRSERAAGYSGRPSVLA